MEITLLAHHIEWDTNGDDDVAQSLPTKVEVEVDLRDQEGFADINDQICKQLENLTGWCVIDYRLQGFSAEADYALQMTNATTQSQ